MLIEDVLTLNDNLPEGYRIKIVKSKISTPGSHSDVPSSILIQKFIKDGFLQLGRGWTTIGQIDQKTDEIYINRNDFLYEYEVILQAMTESGISGPLIMGEFTKTQARFLRSKGQR
jgi:hypothetical protein